MKNLIICFLGRMCSGKTTISKRVSHILHIKRITADSINKIPEDKSVIVDCDFETYLKLKENYPTRVTHILLTADGGVRLSRAIALNRRLNTRSYESICEQFLFESKTLYSDEHTVKYGLLTQFRNDNSEDYTAKTVSNYLRQILKE